MIWLILFVFFILLGLREILFALLLLTKRPKPWTDSEGISDFLMASGRKPPQIFLTPTLFGKAIGWKSLFGNCLFVEKDWWLSLKSTNRKVVLAWFSNAEIRQIFIQRLMGFGDPKLIDRDCLFTGISSTDLIEVIDSLKHDSLKISVSILEAGLLGLSIFGGLQAHQLRILEERIQSILYQVQRLQKTS